MAVPLSNSRPDKAPVPSELKPPDLKPPDLKPPDLKPVEIKA